MFEEIQYSSPKFPDPDKHKDFAISMDLIDLISKLLEKNPDYRMGSLEDSLEILQHWWFDGFPIETVLEKLYEPSFIP